MADKKDSTISRRKMLNSGVFSPNDQGTTDDDSRRGFLRGIGVSALGAIGLSSKVSAESTQQKEYHKVNKQTIKNALNDYNYFLTALADIGLLNSTAHEDIMPETTTTSKKGDEEGAHLISKQIDGEIQRKIEIVKESPDGIFTLGFAVGEEKAYFKPPNGIDDDLRKKLDNSEYSANDTPDCNPNNSCCCDMNECNCNTYCNYCECGVVSVICGNQPGVAERCYCCCDNTLPWCSAPCCLGGYLC